MATLPSEFTITYERRLCKVDGEIGSEYFKSLPDGKYDAFIAFAFNGKEWIVSMYSTSTDVSVICKKYGGGHRAAAGFHVKELPFGG